MNLTFYRVCRTWAGAALRVMTAVRHFDVPALEPEQAVLIASNHQSYLDPMLVGMAFERPMHFLAYAGLFRPPLFGALLAAAGAHPIKQGRRDVSAIRTLMQILRDRQLLVIFPEGERTFCGELGEFKAGVGSLAVRCGVPVLPACIEGAYQCWPRTGHLPRPARVAVAFGELLWPNGAKGADVTAALRERVASLQIDLRQYLSGAGEGRLSACWEQGRRLRQ